MTETILWRRLDLPGHEVATLEALHEGWRLSGTALFAYEDAPCKLGYVVTCGADWLTNSATVRGRIGAQPVDVSVSVDAERRWVLNGVEVPGVAGCLDVDLNFSPSTNLLPIRRLALRIGEEGNVNAAWLRFPSFGLELLPQVYRRESERTYRYESRGNFVRTLEANPAGFVTNYPDFWRAECSLTGG